MKLRGSVLGVVFLVGSAAVAMQGSAKNQNVDSLQGGWTAVLIFNNGAEVPNAQAKGGELTVEDNEYQSRLGANAVTATIEVDSSRTPKQIDFTYKEGPQKGKKIKGIYKLSGDELTICRGLTDKAPRPLEFAAPLESGLLLVTWKKSKTVVSAKAKAIEEELKRFNATWHFVSVEAEGMQIPLKAFQKDTLVLKGKRFASFVGGKLVHGDFKIDPLAKPKTIDIIFTEGPGKGHMQRGIYELNGDTQKLCVAMPDQPRPTDFVSRIDSGHIIQVLKRQTP